MGTPSWRSLSTATRVVVTDETSSDEDELRKRIASLVLAALGCFATSGEFGNVNLNAVPKRKSPRKTGGLSKSCQQ
jgi:hypothetical protein